MTATTSDHMAVLLMKMMLSLMKIKVGLIQRILL